MQGNAAIDRAMVEALSCNRNANAKPRPLERRRSGFSFQYPYDCIAASGGKQEA